MWLVCASCSELVPALLRRCPECDFPVLEPLVEPRRLRSAVRHRRPVRRHRASS